MKGRKGFTLIETVIAISLFAFVFVGSMQGLNSSILGSHRARMNNAAMDVARSQIEYVHQQEYIVHDEYGYPIEWNETQEQWVYLDAGNESYDTVMDLPDGFYYDDIDISVSLVPAPGSGYDYEEVNRSAMQQINVTVTYENGGRSISMTGYKAPRLVGVIGNQSIEVLNRSAMQQITVTLSYENGERSMKLVGYKAPRLAQVVRGAGRYPVSKEITDIPGMWGISGGGAQGVPYDMVDCCGSEGCHPENECSGWGGYGGIDGGEGYYYVFRTGTAGPICCSWIYRDHPDSCFGHPRRLRRRGAGAGAGGADRW